MPNEKDAAFRDFLENEGYRRIRMIDNKWYGIHPMLYTVGVFCDLGDSGPNNARICFKEYQDAAAFLHDWDGKRTPTEADGVTADKRKIRD